MSSEWLYCRLEDLAASKDGAIAIGPFGSRLKADCYVDSGVAIIRGTNLAESKNLSGEFVYISEEKAYELGNANLKPEDLVFPHRGNIGAVGLVPDDGLRYALSTSLMKITLDTQRALPSFYYYFFRSQRGQAELLKNASRVGTPGIATPLTSLRGCVVPFPSLNEQEAAVAVLSSLDDRIALLRETNATLEAIAQAHFKSWFVDFDPVRAKAEGQEPEGLSAEIAGLFPDSFDESGSGLVPKGWSQTTLGQVGARHGGSIQTGPFGSQLHASDYVVAGVPVIMPKDLANRRVNEQSIARIQQSDADRLARHKVQAGDIVFSRRGDVERHALIGELEAGWICGTGCLLVRPGSAWPSPTFLSMALDEQRARKWLVRHAVGATMPNLNTGILADVPLLMPQTEILGAFENIVKATEEKRSANFEYIQVLTDLRDALLPRLISGQLRLPEAEALLQDAA